MNDNKDKRITIRLSKEDYDELSKEAKNNRMGFSQYVRYRLSNIDQNNDYDYCRNSEIGMNGGSIPPGSLLYYETTSELVRLEHYIEMLPKTVANKREMKGVVSELWRLLR